MSVERQLEVEDSEDGRMRGDSDVTMEPDFHNDVPRRSSRSNRRTVNGDVYILPEEEEELDSRASHNSDLAQILSLLRKLLVLTFGLGLGLLLGSKIYKSNISSSTDISNAPEHDSAFSSGDSHAVAEPNLRTQYPTPEPTAKNTLAPFTAEPTASPTFVADSPVSSINDPRFGDEYVIEEWRSNQWQLQETEKNKVKSEIKLEKDTNPNSIFRERVCDRYPNPPPKYILPPMSYTIQPDWHLFRRHVRQTRFALTEHYHSNSYDHRKFYSPSGDQRLKLLNRLATLFKARIGGSMKSSPHFTIGTMGTSVMSGHDNCYYYTYGPLLQRSLEKLFAPVDATFELRQMGQNGDGPNQFNQLLCAPQTLGKIDLLHLYYPMMPQESAIIKTAFSQRMISMGTLHIHLVDADMKFTNDIMNSEGYFSWNEKLRQHIDWTPKHFWGRRDDGLCHNVTREGAVGVSMQNWHLGPIAFQVIVDQVILLYIDALEVALDAIISQKNIPKPSGFAEISSIISQDCANARLQSIVNRDTPQLEYIFCKEGRVENLGFQCGTGFFPQFTTEANLYESFILPSVVLGEKNPFPRIGQGATDWLWSQTKRSSRATATEATESNYYNRAECNNHPDVGYQMVTSKPTRSTQWLTFKMPAKSYKVLKPSKKMNVYVCTGRRDKGFLHLTGFRVLFGVNGRVWGQGRLEDEPYSETNCIRLNRPNAIDVFSPDTIFGVRFINSNTSSNGVTIAIGNLMLVGDEDRFTPVPSVASRDSSITEPPVPIVLYTKQPTISRKDTITPSLDTDDVRVPTTVPSSDSIDEEPTSVPSPN